MLCVYVIISTIWLLYDVVLYVIIMYIIIVSIIKNYDISKETKYMYDMYVRARMWILVRLLKQLRFSF